MLRPASVLAYWFLERFSDGSSATITSFRIHRYNSFKREKKLPNPCMKFYLSKVINHVDLLRYSVLGMEYLVVTFQWR